MYRRIPDTNIMPSSAAGGGIPLNLFVATTGSDSTGLGTEAAPFATIGKARDYITANSLNVRMSRDIVVSVASGTYRTTSIIQFGSNDTASDGFTITFRSPTPGGARIVMSQQVTGWQIVSGSIYRAFVGAATAPSTVYVDGVRARRCRFPKYVANATYPMARATYLSAEGIDDSAHQTLQYVSGNLSPGAWNLTDGRATLWSGGSLTGGNAIAWFSDTASLSAVNTSTRQFTLAQGTKFSPFTSPIGGRYFVEGVLDLLTEAGEWFYNSVTGYLYLWHPTDIFSATVEVPLARRAFEFAGSSETALVRGLVLDGLSIENTDFAPQYRQGYINAGDAGGSHTYPEYDQQVSNTAARQGSVYLENCQGISVVNCNIKNAGLHGIYGFGYNREHTLSGNWIHQCAHSGIFINGKYPAEGDVSNYNAILNTKINSCGELCGSGGGIAIFNSGRNTVRNVEIYDCTRYGIFLASLAGATASDVYSTGNAVSYAKMYRLCQDSGDVGGYYVYGTGDKTNSLTQSTIDSVAAHPAMLDVAPDGVFCDVNTNGQVFTDVQVTNAAGFPFRQFLSSGHSLTNCSFKTDGTANGSFDSSRLDTANIGVSRNFPYA